MNLNYYKMKFLRLAFYVLIAQLVLSGCAGEGVEETSSSSSSEINFDAYVGRDASTRSNITDIDFLRSGEWNAGFGVFARYGNTHLLDTEHVTWNKDQNRWEYTNTRFWPSSGKVDFYAFARYVPIVTMGCLPGDSLGNSKEETYINFPSNESPIDLIWAKKTGQEAPTSPGSKVAFQFKHALSRLSFKITANQKLLEDGAVIKVKEVRLYGAEEYKGIFRMAGYLNLNSNSGDWRPYNNGVSWFYTWTETGTKDGVNDSIQKIDGPVLKLSASKLDRDNKSITNDGDSYIFIIPQKLPENFNIMITYTVTQGDFVEELTVKKNLRDVLLKKDSNFKFEQGKAYVFNLKLLDPINFKVTTDVVPWNEVKDETMPL